MSAYHHGDPYSAEGDLAGSLISGAFVRLFKPSCAYRLFVSVIILVLTVFTAGAEDPDDRVLPILGLLFVGLVLLGQGIQAVRRNSDQSLQAHAPVPGEQTETILPDEEVKTNIPGEQAASNILEADSQLQGAIPQKDSQIALAVVSAMITGFIHAFLIIVIGMFAITSNRVLDDGFGVGLFVYCLSPLASVVGAIISLIVIKLVRHRRPDAPLVRAAVMSGISTGLVLGIASGLFYIVVGLQGTR